MGQAKQRKMNDPNYGKPLHRGLIICPKTKIGKNDVSLDGSLNPQELRFALMFWDKLVWPGMGLIKIEGTEDDQYLEQVGVLDRPVYRLAGPVQEVVLNSQLMALRDREAKQPGQWGLLQGENALHFSDELYDPGKGAAIELIRAVPIPTMDTPLAEILEFKERRRDELLAFRQHMEALARNVYESADQSAELITHISEIQKVCSDLTTVGKEFQFPMHVADFKAALNLKPTLVGEVTGAWQWGSTYGLEIATVAAAVAGVRSAVKLEGRPALRPIKVPASPYKYAYHISKEFI